LPKRRNLATKLVLSLLPFVFVFALHQTVRAEAIELSLDDSIALALKNNPVVKIADAAREKSVWGIKRAKSGKGFTLGYMHNDIYSDQPPTFMPTLAPVPYYYFYTNRFDIALPIYTGGKVESAIDQAQIGLEMSDLRLEATKQQLRLETTTAYFQVLQTRNQLEVARRTVDDFTAHLRNIIAQYNVGNVAKFDILQTKVQLANAEDGLIRAQNSYDLAVANLNKIIGLPMDSQLKLKEDLAYREYNLTLDDSIKYALKNRPEMLQAQKAIASAQDQLKIARSGNSPTISLVGTNMWSDFTFPGLNNANWTVGFSLQMNLLDAGLTKAQIQQAQADVTMAREQAQQTSDNIKLEVRQAFLRLKEAEKRIETNSVVLEQAEENLRLAKERYDNGVGTNLDVIDAELGLAQSKTNYIQALYDYNVSKAQLDKAMGVKVGTSFTHT